MRVVGILAYGSLMSDPVVTGEPRSVQGGGPGTFRIAQSERALVIIGVRGRTLVVDEVGGTECCRNDMEGEWSLGEVEAIGKVVGWNISVPQRRQLKCGLDELQDATEVVGNM